MMPLSLSLPQINYISKLEILNNKKSNFVTVRSSWDAGLIQEVT